MDGLAAAFAVLPGFLVIGLITAGTARAAARGELALNGLVGIRTRATRRSEAAWEAGHRAACRPMFWCAAVCAASVVVVLGVAIGGGSEVAVLLCAGVCGVAAMACLFVGVYRADTAARRVGDPDRHR